MRVGLPLWRRRNVPELSGHFAVVPGNAESRLIERSLYLFLATLAFGTAAFAQSVIRVQFLDGKTGKPLKKLSVAINLNSAADHTAIEALRLHTDENGMVDIRASGNELIRANPEQSHHMSCQTGSQFSGGTYEARRILRTGITEDNHCSNAKFVAPKPGLLVVGYRSEKFVESLGDN